jgi:hypothetical protein
VLRLRIVGSAGAAATDAAAAHANARVDARVDTRAASRDGGCLASLAPNAAAAAALAQTAAWVTHTINGVATSREEGRLRRDIAMAHA